MPVNYVLDDALLPFPWVKISLFLICALVFAKTNIITLLRRILSKLHVAFTVLYEKIHFTYTKIMNSLLLQQYCSDVINPRLTRGVVAAPFRFFFFSRPKTLKKVT